MGCSLVAVGRLPSANLQEDRYLVRVWRCCSDFRTVGATTACVGPPSPRPNRPDCGRAAAAKAAHSLFCYLLSSDRLMSHQSEHGQLEHVQSGTCTVWNMYRKMSL